MGKVLEFTGHVGRDYLGTFEAKCQACLAVSYMTLVVMKPPPALFCAACGARHKTKCVEITRTPAEIMQRANDPAIR